jgi:phosphohistidine phosphatase
MRHGQAAEPNPGEPDRSRTLTPQGARDIELVGQWLRRIACVPDALVCSPLVRARQTARLVAEALGISKAREDERLAHGCAFAELRAIVSACGAVETVLVVGHQPDMGGLTSALIGGGAVAISPGGIASIEIGRLAPGGGALRWLISPRLLR